MTTNPKRTVDYNPYLEQCLKPFLSLKEKYHERGVVELCVNRPKEIWVETREDGWIQHEDESLTIQFLDQFATNLAGAQDQLYDPYKMPLLYTSLPGYGHRIAIAGRGVVQSGFAFSMRVALASKFPLESYFEDSGKTFGQSCSFELDSPVWSGVEDLKRAVAEGINLVIAGGTNSGKTTFFNSLIDFIPKKKRIVIVEDTAELVIPHKNSVRLLKSKNGTDLAGITYEDIVNLTTRFRPDRILLGELDTHNVVPFLRLLNTGHSGCITTVHADAPSLVIDSLAQNTILAGLNPADVREFGRKVIKDVIYLKGSPCEGIRAEHHRISDITRTSTKRPALFTRPRPQKVRTKKLRWTNAA